MSDEIIPPSESPTASIGTSADLWAVWALGCVVAVLGCWFFAFLSVLTIWGGEVSPEAAGTARTLINTAAVVSVCAALLVVAIAIVRGRRRQLSTSAIVVIALAVLSPWMPLYVALGRTIAGE